MSGNFNCKKCQKLEAAKDEAYRAWIGYRPKAGNLGPRGAWFKADREALESAERSYFAAKSRYELHRRAHFDAYQTD